MKEKDIQTIEDVFISIKFYNQNSTRGSSFKTQLLHLIMHYLKTQKQPKDDQSRVVSYPTN